MAMSKCVECGREVSTSAKKCPGCGKPNPTLTGGQRAAGWIFLGLVVVGLAFWLFPRTEPKAPALPPAPTAPTPPAPPPTPREPSPQETARFEECRTKLKLATSLKLLYGVEWKAPDEPRVLVGPTFFTSPIDVKEGLAETVSCFINGGSEIHAVPFNLRHWRTGEAAYRFSGGSLQKL